jgi:hypothetical protein
MGPQFNFTVGGKAFSISREEVEWKPDRDSTRCQTRSRGPGWQIVSSVHT